MLKTIKQIQQPPQEIMRVCEACGAVKPSSRSINFIFVIGSPGHEDFAPFQCPQEEHWACGIECWEKVAIACVQEHGKELLYLLHANKGLIEYVEAEAKTIEAPANTTGQ